MMMIRWCTGLAVGLWLWLPFVVPTAGADEEDRFRVGVGIRDITPEKPMPMWGYGARHDRPSDGVLDRLHARAVVIEAGSSRLALVGLDLGRGPTPAMMSAIRNACSRHGIEHLLICGSHTHHGPVIELTDEPGMGRGAFDDAVAYARGLPDLIVAAIAEAAGKLQPARLGISARDLPLNRNRQSKRPVRPTDPRLTVIRFDREDGAPIAVLVHYTAHPVLTPTDVFKFSADYPGHLVRRVEQELNAPCVFFQGAAGDQSANPPEGRGDPRRYGELLAGHALDLARSSKTTRPAHPSLGVSTEGFRFGSRINFKSPVTRLLYGRAFFPELVRNYLREFEDGVNPEVTTVLLNRELAIVGVPGEPFCQHAVRLRERAYVPWTLVLGYCNGHLLYFPTIEAASEGGYGADARMSPAAVGAGEQMMNQALIAIYRMLGKFPGATAVPETPAAAR
jgi:hypothetical protein